MHRHIIPENVVALLGVDSLHSSNVTLKSYSNHVMKPVGQVLLRVQVGTNAKDVLFQVIANDVANV